MQLPQPNLHGKRAANTSAAPTAPRFRKASASKRGVLTWGEPCQMTSSNASAQADHPARKATPDADHCRAAPSGRAQQTEPRIPHQRHAAAKCGLVYARSFPQVRRQEIRPSSALTSRGDSTRASVKYRCEASRARRWRSVSVGTVGSAAGAEQAARACDPSPGNRIVLSAFSARHPNPVPPNRRGCQIA